jgi:hypothetical protein
MYEQGEPKVPFLRKEALNEQGKPKVSPVTFFLRLMFLFYAFLNSALASTTFHKFNTASVCSRTASGAIRA